MPTLVQTKRRCGWADGDPLQEDSLMRVYHDLEWGVPLHDDRRLFEAIILDGAQAGLSWRTILLRREGYRKAFHHFDAKRVAAYGSKDIQRLLKDRGIIRNRLKIRSAIQNASAYLKLREEFGSFDRYIWGFVGGKTIQNRWRSIKQIPTRSAESDALSKDLKQRGFNFVGSTICYAFMQASGLVNDHMIDCFRYKDLAR